MRDETDPLRPHDPPWRSRTAHRSLDPAAVAALRSARQRLGWSKSQASRRTGVSRSMILKLEEGTRRPSIPLAKALIRGYANMSPGEARTILDEALADVGRDSPYRDGWRPPPEHRHPPEPAAWDEAYVPPPENEDNPWTAVYAPGDEAARQQRLSALRPPRR